MKNLNMKEHNTNGILITFCGLDGCGKSTMIKMLKEKLKTMGKEVVLTKQPTEQVRKSEIFRTYMDSEEHDLYDYRALSLFAASDRIQHSNKVILPDLQDGKTVISDRYFYSCVANLHARGYVDDEWIYEISSDIPKPDLAFFLDLPVETAIERVRARPEERERYIDVDLQHRLRDEYIDICKSENGILIESNGIPRETFEKIWSVVKGKVDDLKSSWDDKSITEQVYRILEELSGTRPEDGEVYLTETLALDSFRMVTLLIMVEECFAIELNESDMNPFDLKTVNDVVLLSKKYLNVKEK